jgi:hypothetical protein
MDTYNPLLENKLANKFSIMVRGDNVSSFLNELVIGLKKKYGEAIAVSSAPWKKLKYPNLRK